MEEKSVVELCDLLYEGTESIFAACASRQRERLMLNESPSDAPKAAMVRLGCERLQASLRFIFDNEFDKLELYVMRNVLHFSTEASNVAKGGGVPLDQPASRDDWAVDEDLLDAEIAALAGELTRATEENEALKFRQISAQGHVDRLKPLIEGPPDIIARAQAAALNFPDLSRDVGALRQAATDLSHDLAVDNHPDDSVLAPSAENNNPPPSSPS